MTTNPFAEYTRSTAFSMSLSAKMVDRILRLDARIRGWEISADLATRYDWYHPDGPPAFGPTSTEEMLADGLTNTSRALLRRGLIEIATLDIAEERLDIINDEIVDTVVGISHQSHYLTLTTAGRLTAQLLVEAGFDPYPPMVRPVHLHPDDRVPVNLGPPSEDRPKPRDRRVDLMLPEDEPYLEYLWKNGVMA